MYIAFTRGSARWKGTGRICFCGLGVSVGLGLGLTDAVLACSGTQDQHTTLFGGGVHEGDGELKNLLEDPNLLEAPKSSSSSPFLASVIAGQGGVTVTLGTTRGVASLHSVLVAVLPPTKPEDFLTSVGLRGVSERRTVTYPGAAPKVL